MSKTQKTTNTTAVDPDSLARQNALYTQGQTLTSQPYQAFGGERVAGTTPLMDQGLAGLPGAAAAGQGAVADARAGYAGVSGYQPGQVAAPQLGPAVNAGFTGAGPAATANSTAALSYLSGAGGTAGGRDVSSLDAASKMGQYTNPWENQVVQSALGDQEIQRQQAIRQGQAGATLGGAFGGSRHGVMDSLTNEAAIRAAGATSGALRSAGFNTALGAGAADADRNLNAQVQNQQKDVATSIANSGVNAQLASQRAGIVGQNDQFNASQVNSQGQFNAGQANTVGMYNAGQANDMTRTQGGLDLSAAQGNVNAGLTANGQRLGAAQGMASLGAQEQSMGLQGADALVRGGQITQGINQQGLDASYESWLRGQDDPYKKLAFQQGLMPTPTMTSTNTQKGSALGGILGAVGTIAGGPIGGMIGGLFKGAPAPAAGLDIAPPANVDPFGPTSPLTRYTPPPAPRRSY